MTGGTAKVWKKGGRGESYGDRKKGYKRQGRGTRKHSQAIWERASGEGDSGLKLKAQDRPLILPLNPG